MSQGWSWNLPSRRLCVQPPSPLTCKGSSPGFRFSLRCLYVHFLCPFVEASLASAYGEGWLFLLSSGHLHRQRIPRFPAPGLSAELWTLRILQAGQQAGYLIMQCLLHASSSVCTRCPSLSPAQGALPCPRPHKTEQLKWLIPPVFSILVKGTFSYKNYSRQGLNSSLSSLSFTLSCGIGSLFTGLET